ncbi:hypothetical protein D3C71_1833010 [compost metagenome]
METSKARRSGVAIEKKSSIASVLTASGATLTAYPKSSAKTPTMKVPKTAGSMMIRPPQSHAATADPSAIDTAKTAM